MAEALTIPIELEDAPLPVQLVFEKVSIEVTPPHGPLSRAPPVKRILDEVSGIFGPAECIACMRQHARSETRQLCGRLMAQEQEVCAQWGACVTSR